MKLRCLFISCLGELLALALLIILGGGTPALGYCEEGNRSGRNANGAVTTWVYDAADRLTLAVTACPRTLCSRQTTAMTFRNALPAQNR
jgi:hypothetical protein